MSPLSWLLVALSWIGAFVVGKWSRDQISAALVEVDAWADNRAFMLCARAIVAYEFQRGRHIGPSIKYALKIMRGGSR
jgi:hypothetical protein